VRELERVLVVDAVHAGGLGDHVGLDFERPQGGRGIGGKVRIGGARREDDDAPLFQVTDGAAANVGLGHLVHFDGARHALRNSHLFEGVARANELMTVASMPIWSPVTRSILRAAAATPRKILPPPTTTPT